MDSFRDIARSVMQRVLHSRGKMREEHGSLTVFALFFFVGLLMATSVAIDMIRYEQERVRIQGALDRAVLAATSLRQTQEIETVIRDYLETEGVTHLISDIRSEDGLNFRQARVEVGARMPTMMMRLVGINSLPMRISAAAEERVPNLEISLVLDLSGSMNNFNRLPNLQSAAREFIETIFEDAEGANVSVSLVPYTGQVNAGAALLSHFNVTHRQSFSHCIDFDDHHYDTTALSTMASLQGAGHGNLYLFPDYGYYNQNDPLGDAWGNQPIYDCPIGPGNAGVSIRAFSADPDELIDRINAMQALGATSIDIGMRWGVALLDPSVRPAVSGMIADGQIDPRLAGRPSAFDDGETMKIVVLMTDGENFQERRLRDHMRSGLSPVWVNPQAPGVNTFSLFDANRAGTNRYWHRRNASWNATPYGGNNARQLTWPELFHIAYPYWAARHIFAEALAGTTNNARNTYARTLSQSWLLPHIAPATKDQRLLRVCNAARNSGITVFSVAFEADAGGIAGLRACASTSGHFFDVEGVEISEAFRSIASHIRQLRLTE